MLSQHLNKRRVNVDNTESAFRFDGDFLPVPNGAPDVELAGSQVQIIYVQAGCFTYTHTATRQQCEQRSPLSLCGTDDSLHLIGGKVPLLFRRVFLQGQTPIPYLPWAENELQYPDDVPNRLRAELFRFAVPTRTLVLRPTKFSDKFLCLSLVYVRCYRAESRQQVFVNVTRHHFLRRWFLE